MKKSLALLMVCCLSLPQIASAILPAGGDLDGDYDVDTDDYQVFRASFGFSAGDPAYNPEADIDADGSITLADYQDWLALYRGYQGGQIVDPPLVVRFDPADKEVGLGETFTVDIVADITDAILGWGLDLTIVDTAVVAINANPSIGPLWDGTATPDGDGLVGLSFPGSVVGNDILLATLSFSAIGVGDTDLLASVSGGDLTEGFALDPTGFAEITYEAGHVTVTPEPATVILLGLGGLGILKRWR